MLANKENEAAIERRIFVNKIFAEKYVDAVAANAAMLRDDDFFENFRCRDLDYGEDFDL